MPEVFLEIQRVTRRPWRRPGDYYRAEPESVHGEVFTEAGALFVVLSSTRDELLA